MGIMADYRPNIELCFVKIYPETVVYDGTDKILHNHQLNFNARGAKSKRRSQHNGRAARRVSHDGRPTTDSGDTPGAHEHP
jgi:hypothetical protein